LVHAKPDGTGADLHTLLHLPSRKLHSLDHAIGIKTQTDKRTAKAAVIATSTSAILAAIWSVSGTSNFPPLHAAMVRRKASLTQFDVDQITNSCVRFSCALSGVVSIVEDHDDHPENSGAFTGWLEIEQEAA
jgi:hypothetical protein